MQNSELLDFTAGMNTVEAPHLISKNEAIVLANVDVQFGSLKSITNLDNTTSAQSPFFVEYTGKLYYYDQWRTNALIDDKLYWADGIDTGKILPDGRELPLGIATPKVIITQTLDGAVGDGIHEGDFKYTYTFYSMDTGIESAPAPLPNYIKPVNQNIVLTGFEGLPIEADSYRIYRIGGYLTRFTLVDTITAIDIPYIDSLDETEIDGRLLQTLRSGPPPTNVDNFVELNGRLFGSVGNLVYFSGLGAPDSWYTDDFFNLPDTVVGLAKVPAGLLILGSRYSYLLFGGGPSNFRMKVISNYLGCVSNRSIAYYNNKVLWLGVDGIYMSDGYSIKNLTYRKIENISNLDITSSAVANDVYYMSFKPSITPTELLVPSNDLYPGAPIGTGGVDGFSQGLISMDFRRGKEYSYSILEYETALSIGIHRGVLYLVLDGTREVLLCNQTFPCDIVFCFGDYILAKLGGTINDTYKELSYVSPQLIDGSYSTLKEYDKVRVNFIGEFTVAVKFSTSEIAITETIKSKVVVLTNGELSEQQDGLAIIGIPNGSNKSFSIQFIVKGKGIIKSIQYSWNNRKLP